MFGHAKHPRVLLGVCVFAVVAIAAVTIFESSPVLLGASTDPVAQVQGDYSAHLESIHSMNISAIEQAYEKNATLQFIVPGSENTGNQSGLKNIGILYAADIFPNFALPRFSSMNSTVKVAGSSATVDSSFIIGGFNSDANPRSARVIAHTLYVKDGGSWLIYFESWSFTFRAGGQP